MYPWYYYVVALLSVIILNIASNKWTNSFANSDRKDDYEMVKQYLLNESPLYGYNKPKLWIHSEYVVNARQWKSFMSRNTTDLNQPYLYLTIQSIVNHCSRDFNICLIDDETFSKLIPTWDIHLSDIAEPMKHQLRQTGLLQLLYYYGGVILPNSFLSLKSFISEYNLAVQSGKPRVGEEVTVNPKATMEHKLFTPGFKIMAAEKNSPIVKTWIESIKHKLNNTNHFNSEMDFNGYFQELCEESVRSGNATIISGKQLGIRDKNSAKIGIEELLGDGFINTPRDILGIYVPADEILSRNKYSWYAVIPIDNVLDASVALTKYFKRSMIDSTSDSNRHITVI